MPEPELLDDFYLPYLYVFWRQAEPSAAEVAAVHRVDPSLRTAGAGDVASRLRDSDFWRIGPVAPAADARVAAGQLRMAGLRVEERWQ